MIMKRIISIIVIFAFALISVSAYADDVVYGELTKGSKGDAVKALQERLKELGYYTISVDGDYGNGTVNALNAFQARNGLEQDGIATVELQQLLFSADAIPAPKNPDVEVVTVKKNGNTISFTYKNNLDEPIDYIEYYIIPYNSNGNVTSGSTLDNYDILAGSYSENVTVKPNSTKTIEYDWSEYDVRDFPTIAVGIFSYHTVGGKTVGLAAEQTSFRKSDGSVVLPTDEDMEVRSMSPSDYDEARRIKFGYSSYSIQYYAEPFYMMPSGDYLAIVDSDSMAEKAGLKVGDVLISYNGDKAVYPYAAEYAKQKILAGEKVEVKYWRANKEYTTFFALDMDEAEEQGNDSNEVQYSVADELLKLADLLEKGILTQEEFDAQKEKLLGD